ncbi:RNA polymerase sigma-70 factor, ECF subfamily [Chitinophaga sp. CF118]|uniref:RNA polymerase sigma factor n=1 Tax=Chitinophaga sp. CF118 TaxID=1884367 RepID=UPI0008EB727A|nr:sigma-70 family RNA polymerase sigma factor [Chitinophaga sp. CF118]SFE45358.1 RNA polymerase sigma-70 factor, ECF subfamily [Chitinophaga sp. CF118]
MQPKQKLEDLELFRLIQAGDEGAFSQIHDKYFHTIYLSAYVVLREHAEAEDVAQEVLITFWNRRNKIHIESTLSAYLTKAAHNLSLNKYNHNQKNKKRNRRYSEEAGTIEPPSTSTTEEWQDALNDAIKELPEMSRRSIEMVYWEKRSHKEVAEITGLSVNTIKTQIYTSIKNIREKLRSK